MNTYTAAQTRYDGMQYRYAGHSGLKLPVLSLGLWHNFGDGVDDAVCRQMIATAFDHGITHFDLANNYGPPAGSAEARFGRMLSEQFGAYRDEMLISTKAGYYMWPGPYGEWGSRKYLIASCDASLKRMGLEYVDIFYHHRPDPNTPLEETMGALAQLVRQGKALYVGISNYHRADAVKAIAMLKQLGCPCVLNQVRYSLLDRWVEDDHLLDGMKGETGTICFSPLAQGLLSDRYLEGTIPPRFPCKQESFPQAGNDHQRAGGAAQRPERHCPKTRAESVRDGHLLAIGGQSGVTSVLIGASSAEQVKVNLKAVGKSPDFSQEELSSIDELCMRWK